MTKQEIEKELVTGISEIISMEAAAVDPKLPFRELGLDSLGFVELLVFIEKTFAINLVETDLTKKDFETIDSLSSFLSRKL